MKQKIFLFPMLCCLLLPLLSNAQDGEVRDIRFHVFDALSQSWVPNVNILILKDGEAFREGVTDGEGDLVLTDLPEGEYTFEVTCNDCEPLEETHTVDYDQDFVFTVKIQRGRTLQYYYIDGVKVYSDSIPLPAATIKEIVIIEGGVPYEYYH